MSTAIHLVFVSCPPAAASALAETLVRERVAACVNILPQMHSVYRWQGELQRDDEALLIIKAPASGFEALKKMILAHHPFELPEIIAVNPAEGHAPYLDWLLSTCQ
jgi:periplasmic divalent cation tolerance protein